MSTSYFIWSTQKHITEVQAAEINSAIKAIQNDADFVRHYAPGNPTHGWIERPNDGTNDYNYQRELNRKCAEAAKKILGLPVDHGSQTH